MFPRNEQNDLKSPVTKAIIQSQVGRNPSNTYTKPIKLYHPLPVIPAPASTPPCTVLGNTWTKGILRPCCDQTAGGWDDSETLSPRSRPDQSFFMWAVYRTIRRKLPEQFLDVVASTSYITHSITITPITNIWNMSYQGKNFCNSHQKV